MSTLPLGCFVDKSTLVIFVFVFVAVVLVGGTVAERSHQKNTGGTAPLTIR